MSNGVMKNVRAVSAWAKSTFDAPVTFVTHVEGLDPAVDLDAQLRDLEVPREFTTALLESQSRTMKASMYVRQVLDALHERRVGDAEQLIRRQAWPAINVTSSEADLVKAIAYAMSIGEVEVDVAVAHRNPNVAEVRLILGNLRLGRLPPPHRSRPDEAIFQPAASVLR